MGFSDSVQWWEEWQLRLLALASLFTQCFLLVAAPMRKHRIPSLLRFSIWIAFLGSDAVAIYVLATIFNRHKKPDWMSAHRDRANLEALWAPILLLHLGGQYSITAYNIEDTELWRRHVVNGLSQISVAIYVFRKSWSGDKKLLVAAMLVFVPGIIKCLQKPWAIKESSINNIMKSYHGCMNKKLNSLEDYVKAAVEYVQGGNKGIASGVIDVPTDTNLLFVELAYPYDDRLYNLKSMLEAKIYVQSCLRIALSRMFDSFYTWYKHRIYLRINMNDIRTASSVYLLFAAIALFHKSHREAYNDADVKITYILLSFTVGIEIGGAAMKQYVEELYVYRPWPDLVSQYNFIGYLVRNRNHRRLRGLASRVWCKDLLDQLWCMAPCKSSGNITELVHDHVTEGWKSYIKDVPSYHRFNDSRGQWTLQRHECDGKNMKPSLRGPFDESVLLWHLATDLCFYHRTDSSSSPPTCDAAHRSREISNYMVYLLFVNPDMLMPGSRSSMFNDVYQKLKGMVLDDGEAPKKNTWLSKAELAQKIIQKLKNDPEAPEGSDFIHDSWAIARELLDIGKEDGEAGGEKMWKVIQGVWVEMLCFSAARCRGYLHAKSMGRGGEYLTSVWLLLWMGMEPLSEKMQRTEVKDEGPNGGDAGTPASASQASTTIGED